jgi:hypothetical protein
MPWNYRLFHTCYRAPGASETVDYWSIREVYERPDGSIVWIGAEASRPSGSTRTELLKDLALMHEAFARPVLTPDAIPGYTYGSWERAPGETTTATPQGTHTL